MWAMIILKDIILGHGVANKLDQPATSAIDKIGAYYGYLVIKPR